MTTDFRYYKVNIRTGNKTTVKWVYSNLYQKDIVKRLFNKYDTFCNGEFINPSCLRFTVIPRDDSIGSIVYVTTLYPEEVFSLEKTGEVKRWKRIYSI